MPRFFVLAQTILDAPTRAEATELMRSKMPLDSFPETVDVSAEPISAFNPLDDLMQRRERFRKAGGERPRGVLT